MFLIQQLFLIFIFLVISLISFTLPGFGILKNLRINLSDFFEEFIVSSVVGVVLFTLSAYLLAAFNLRFLMWLYPIIGLFLLFIYRKSLFQLKINLTKNLLFWFSLVFVLGIISQVSVNAFSGISTSNGVIFYSSHGHDGIWHLSLIEEMKKNVFPFQNPEYAGHRLQNYHFFVDLFMSEISRLYFFSNMDVYFRLVPTLFATLLGLSSFVLVKSWSGKALAGIWAMFFIYFAGSFGYLVTLPHNLNLNGSETIFWVSQTQSILGNPPHASAFIIFITFLFLFLEYLRVKRWGFFALCILLGGAVVEFKVYAGIIILGGLLFASLYETLFKRRIELLLMFISTLFLALLIYLPNSINSQEFLVWQPWWFIRTMVVAPDRLNWLDLELRRQTYIAEGNYKRVVQVEAIAFLAFFFGNLGMRFVGFFELFKQLKENILKSTFNLMFLVMFLISFFIPLFFLQKGVAWNTIQFNQYFLLLFGLLAAFTFSDLQKFVKIKMFKYFVVLTLILLSVPTQVGLLWQFYSNKPLSRVPIESILALNYLRNNSNPDDIVLTAPFDRDKAGRFKQPLPIYTWYDTGYVSAFSSRKTFLSDEEQVRIMGYHIDETLEERKKVFEDVDIGAVKRFTGKYKIKFIYLEPDQELKAMNNNLELLYQKDGVRIYKI